MNFKKLSLKERLFCRYFIFGSNEEFGIGNGVKSYAKAYEKVLPQDYNTCGVESCVYLKKPKIKEYMADLLVEAGYMDETVDSRLRQIIFDGKDEHSVQAIKEYNKLKQRITEKHDITSKGEKVMGIEYVVPTNAKPTKRDNKTSS